MTYEKALDSFEEAIASVDRRKNPELWHLLQGLHALCTAVRSDVADLKRRHERTQENVARVNAEVTAAQDSLKDLLKGVE